MDQRGDMSGYRKVATRGGGAEKETEAQGGLVGCDTVGQLLESNTERVVSNKGRGNSQWHTQEGYVELENTKVHILYPKTTFTT